MGHYPDIAVRQNTPRSLMLLRAIAVAHRHGQRVQLISLAVSLLTAGLSIVAATHREFVPVAVVIGATWAILYAVVLGPATGRQSRLGATLQEMLETELFDLPWNEVAVGDKVSTDEISRLSRRFRGDDTRLRDYYLVPDVPAPHNIYFCLEQNLAWGPRVRRRYAHVLLAVPILWGITGVTVGIALNVTVAELLNLWVVPSLGLVLQCLDIARAQLAVNAERLRVLTQLRARQNAGPTAAAMPPAAADAEWRVFARQVQDLLFHSRRLHARVPTRFFWRFHDHDIEDFKSKLDELEMRRSTTP
jgi:hypothetical protein